MRKLMLLGVVFVLCGVNSASAQPSTLPLIQPSDIVYERTITLPTSDGRCNTNGGEGCMGYGGWGPGIGPVVGGLPTLYLGGHDWSDQICQVSIPATGSGPAKVVRPCAWLSNKEGIDPGSDNHGTVLGGSLVYNNRLIFSAFAYYDSDGSASRSHWVANPDFTNQQGPFTLGTLGAGRVGGYMTLVPKEWHASLCPALTGLGATSIISRSSWGPSFSCFNPDDVGKINPVPATALAYYPGDHTLGETSSTSKLYNGTAQVRGIGFPSGTRTILTVQRIGIGSTNCYGDADCVNPPDSVDPYKGYHAPPYVIRILAYDANHAVEVKNKKREVWNNRPYADWNLQGPPGDTTFTTRGTLVGAAYDDTQRKLYVIPYYGDSNARVYVFSVGKGAPAPSPVACVGSWSAWVEGPPSACVEGFQSVPSTRQFNVTTPASGGGAACEAANGAVQTKQEPRACTVTPPPPDKPFVCPADKECYPGTVVSDVIDVQGGKLILVLSDGTVKPYMLTADMPNPPLKGTRIFMVVERGK